MEGYTKFQLNNNLVELSNSAVNKFPLLTQLRNINQNLNQPINLQNLLEDYNDEIILAVFHLAKAVAEGSTELPEKLMDLSDAEMIRALELANTLDNEQIHRLIKNELNLRHQGLRTISGLTPEYKKTMINAAASGAELPPFPKNTYASTRRTVPPLRNTAVTTPIKLNLSPLSIRNQTNLPTRSTLPKVPTLRSTMTPSERRGLTSQRSNFPPINLSSRPSPLSSSSLPNPNLVIPLPNQQSPVQISSSRTPSRERRTTPVIQKMPSPLERRSSSGLTKSSFLQLEKTSTKKSPQRASYSGSPTMPVSHRSRPLSINLPPISPRKSK